MKRLSTLLIAIVSLSLAGCGELYHCSDPNSVVLREQLPCTNCEFKGIIKPNLCPNGTYAHKLQCAAQRLGGNLVLLNKSHLSPPDFRVYQCPPPKWINPPPSNWKTDVSHHCC